MKTKETVCKSLYEDLLNIAKIPNLTEQKHKSFLITGGNGFIVSYLVLALLCLNDEYHNDNTITILVRSKEKAVQKYGALVDRNDLKIMVQDVCTSIASDHGFDYIVHAASAASAKMFDDDPIGVFNSNVLGTENLISFIREKPCKSMVYISSFTVYGNETEKVESLDESFRGAEDWNSNRAAYSYGKRSAEFLCTAAWRKYNCPIRIVRPGFVYGTSTPDDSRVYSEIIRNVAEEHPIVLKSAGYVFRSMVYVTDVVRGIISCLLNGDDGEAYNIANEFVSIRQFAAIAAEKAQSNKVMLTFENEADKLASSPQKTGGAMAVNKLMKCGWKPEVSLDKGIVMAAEIYAEQYLKNGVTM